MKDGDFSITKVNEESHILLMGAILKQIYKDRKSGNPHLEDSAIRDLDRLPFPIAESVKEEIKQHYKRETGKEWYKCPKK